METEGIKGASLQLLESLGWSKGGDRSIRSNHLFIDLLVCAIPHRQAVAFEKVRLGDRADVHHSQNSALK